MILRALHAASLACFVTAGHSAGATCIDYGDYLHVMGTAYSAGSAPAVAVSGSGSSGFLVGDGLM